MATTKTICFANNKGGSGKSTTCANIGYSLSTLGKRVLLIDADMQMNLTLYFFDDEKSLEMAKGQKNIYKGIINQKDLSSYTLPTEYENLDLIPSSTLMSSIEFELFTKWQREFILREGLKKIKESGKYDYILIDAPPTLGCWVMNIMCASDFLVIPVEASPWGLFGLANMFEFYEQVKRISPELEILGIAITKASERKNYFKQTVETLSELDNVRLFESIIRVDSTIEWSQDNSKPVMVYKKSSRAAQEYMAMAQEVVKYADR
ncbi:MAG: ParA family protein [Ruminococcaceae bacterium]|nr:ParA family protein [Oscillospiraceae bacterium]